MAQVWYKGNVAGRKWTPENVEDILKATYDWLKSDEKVILKGQVDLYMLETHGVGLETRRNWLKLYKDNISISSLGQAIDIIIENRVVLDKEQMRPNIQGMVLQNKHNYRERKELDGNVKHDIFIKEALEKADEC